MFCGHKMATTCVLELGMNAVGLDKIYSTEEHPQDFLEAAGYKTYVKTAMEVVEGGTAWLAPECTDLIFMGRSGNQRCKYNPKGSSTSVESENTNNK